MFCTKCGNKLPDNANFCTACGNKIAPPTPAPVKVEPTPATESKTVRAGEDEEKTVLATSAVTNNAAGNQVPNEVFNNIPAQKPVENRTYEAPKEPVREPERTKKAKKGTNPVVVTFIFIIILALLAGGAYVGYKLYSDSQFDKLVEDARNCVEKEDYTQARRYYEDAKKMDDEDVDVYLELADVYVNLDLNDKAIDLLNSGYEKTESTEIEKKLAELKSGNVSVDATVPVDGAATVPEGEVATQPAATEAATTAPTVATRPTIEDAAMQVTLRTLMDNNLYYCLHIYHAGSLSTTGQYYQNNRSTNLLRCDTSKFANYSQYENFVYSIYVNARAKHMIELAKYMGPDGALYLNVLYQHPAEENSRATVDAFWESQGYTIEIYSLTADRCEFGARTKQSVNGSLADVVVEGVAVVENGIWKLEGEVY